MSNYDGNACQLSTLVGSHMEWRSFMPILLAIIMFLLVGTIIERKIEESVRRFMAERRALLSQQSENTSRGESEIRSEVAPEDPPPPPSSRRTASQTVFKSSSAVLVGEALRVQGANQSGDHGSNSKLDLVGRIKAKLAAQDPAKARELGGVFLFNIIKGSSVYCWTLDLNNVTVYEGEPEQDPDTTFTLNEHIFKQLVTGREDPRVIMQAGRCSVTGDIMRAMKLEPYIKLN